MRDIGIVLMLFFTGLTAGGMLVVSVDRLSVWKRMSEVDYSTDFRRMLKNLDPMMPIFVFLAGTGALIFSLNSTGSPAALSWCALAGLSVVLVASIVIAEPVNSKFRRLPEGTPPRDAFRYREFWGRFHAVRTSTSVVTHLLVVVAVTLSCVR